MRVHELAKELGVTSKELLASLREMGVDGLTASSSVPDQAVPRLRASGGKAVPEAKMKEAVEEPVPKARPRRKPVEQPSAPEPEPPGLPVLRVVKGATAQDIAERTDRSPADIVKILISLGDMATATQSLSDDAIGVVARELGYEAEIVGIEEDEEEEEQVDEGALVPRAPVVTIMGHVDHGKTLLLDAIRKADVVSQEFGGITQHIGAYQVHVDGREVTFIDTPGHEEFTAMRARGAQVTDIAVLVVAADDGVKPQTIEALDHAKAAGVPIVVAVNKIDKPESDPARVRQQLVEQGIVPAEWGGTHEFVDVSAKARTNLETLLETILLVADVEELKGNPEGRARGAVLEAHLDRGRGPVATVLVQRGSLEVGDTVVSGTGWAKIR